MHFTPWQQRNDHSSCTHIQLEVNKLNSGQYYTRSHIDVYNNANKLVSNWHIRLPPFPCEDHTLLTEPLNSFNSLFFVSVYRMHNFLIFVYNSWRLCAPDLLVIFTLTKFKSVTILALTSTLD